MQTRSKALLAALALGLGLAGLAAAETAGVFPELRHEQAGDHGAGPFALFGHHHGHDRDDDQALAQGQGATPPANGLFQDGTAPKAQLN